MGKVIVLLKGGLGNQMFQYAVARGIKGNNDVVVDLSLLSAYNKSTDIYTAREYELKLFKHAKASVASKFLLAMIHNQKLYYRVIRKLLFNNLNKVKQKGNEFIPLLNEVAAPVYLEGYFQSEKYFNNIRNELLQEFEFPQLDKENIVQLNKINSFPNSVSIHVRRGDYLKSVAAQFHGLLPHSYYKQAIELLKISVANPHYFIFSDDAEWCITHFSFLGDNYTVIEGNDATNSWKDMFLMTQCKHHIIANSSFSWWGAWLSEWADKTVIAPKQWFVSEESNNESINIIPEKWIRL